ncbi:hypothetical protein HY492_00090, partial [Candidatus Woesearchaeota archaeon]|nr:hypothetical protein [Candidatus Woesearchaeota archaeon]
INGYNSGTITTNTGIQLGNFGNGASVTNSYALDIQSQTASVTESRAIRIQGTGNSNAVQLGGSANILATGADNVRIINAATSEGIDINLPTGLGTTDILTASSTVGSIRLQNSTFTPAATHSAVQISPTWASENQNHRGLNISVTQNGANSDAGGFGLEGLRITTTKANVDDTVLIAMSNLTLASVVGAGESVTTNSVINILAPTGGTITNAFGIDIANQSISGTYATGIRIQSQTATATTTLALDIAGTGRNNAIRLGSSPTIYSAAANSIEFTDATNTRGLSFDLTAAGDQSITTFGGGNLSLNQNSFSTGIVFTNAGGARTVPLITVTGNGTVGGAAGGTLFDINVTQTGAMANPLFDIDVTGLYTGDLVNAAIGSGIAYEGDMINLALGDTSTVGQLIVMTAGAAARTTDLITVTDGTTSTGRIMTLTHSGTLYFNGLGFVDITRSGSFTGAPGESTADLSLFPNFTLTEPGSGTFTYTGALINMSSVTINGGVGDSLVSAMTLTGATPIAGMRSRALVLGGTASQHSIQFGTASTAPFMYSSAAETIIMFDSSSTRGISFAMSAAGNQQITTTGGNLVLMATGANVATTAGVDFDMSAGGRFFGGGVQINSQTLAANTNLTMDENDGVVSVTTGADASDETITLPAASGNQGMLISIYVSVDGGDNVDIVRAGSDVIQNGSADLGNTAIECNDAGDFVQLQVINATMFQIIQNSGCTVT